MLRVLTPIFIPLLSLVILTLGNGLFTTFLVLRLDDVGTPDVMVGAISAAYYLGMIIGAFRAERLILRAGHIRTYAAFASLIGVTTLLFAIVDNTWVWLMLRFSGGYCMAALFIVIESWVLVCSDSKKRGTTLSFYMVAIYGAQAGGQFILNMSPIGSVFPFIIATIFATLSVVPLTLSKIESPQFDEPKGLSFKRLYDVSPSGVFGCLVAGLVLGNIYGLLPLYAVKIDLAPSQIAWVMGTTIFGGMTLQLPMGRLSDFIPRRLVLILICTGLIFSSLTILMASELSFPLLLLFYFFFGGFAFTLYPISISHACDYLEPNEIVSATQGLLFAYGIGATLGPIFGGIVIAWLGPSGLFMYFISVIATLGLFVIWRKTQVPGVPVAEQQDFVSMPVTNTPILNELDPRAEETN